MAEAEAKAKALSTFGIQLLRGETKEAMKNLVDIKDYGDLIGDPNTIDVTTLRDKQQTFITGIMTSDKIPFTCNYTSETFQAVKNLAGKPGFYAVRFSDKSGVVWQGEHTCGIPGKGVDDAVEFTVNVTNSSPVEFEASITATDDAP